MVKIVLGKVTEFLRCFLFLPPLLNFLLSYVLQIAELYIYEGGFPVA